MIILSRLQVRNFKSLRAIDLVFPREASILVEGLNESGKSTLFKSVYFALYGEPLVAEETGSRGRARYDSAIHYEADQALVALDLDVDGTEITVTRVLRRERPAKAHLRIALPGGESEEVDGARAVTDRLILELGKLDKESLLNSCFVEQKKLSKLEDLSRPERQGSLEHLLNLDKLQALQDEFKVRPADQQALATAKDRYRLAQNQARIPEIEADLAALDSRIVAVDIHEALARIAEAERALVDVRDRLAAIDAEQATLQGQLEQIGTLKAHEARVRDLARVRERIGEREQQVAQAQAELANLERQERDELPRLAARLAALTELRDALQRRDALAAELRACEEGIRAADEELAEIAQHESAAAQLVTQIRAATDEIAQLQDSVARDEERARTDAAAAEARLDALHRVEALLTSRRDLAARRERAEAERERARALTADYAALQQRVATTTGALTGYAQDAEIAEQQYSTAARARDELRALLTAQQEREREYEAALRAAKQARTQAAEYADLRAQLAEADAEHQARTGDVQAAETAYARATSVATHLEQLADAQHEQERAYAGALQKAEEVRARAEELARLHDEREAAAADEQQRAEAVAHAESAYAAAEQAERDARVARARRLWAQGQRTNLALASSPSAGPTVEDRVRSAEQAHGAAQRTLAGVQRRVQLLGPAGILGLLVSAALLVAGIPAGVVVLVLGLVVIALAARAYAATRPAREALDTATRDLEATRQAALRQVAEREAAAALGSGAARVAEAEAELRELDAPIPTSLADVEEAIANAGPQADLTALRSATNAARKDLEGARTAHKEAEILRARLDAEIGRHPLSASGASAPEDLPALAAAVQKGRGELVAAARTHADAGDYPATANPEAWADPDADRASLNALETWTGACRDALEQARTFAAQATATVRAMQSQVARHPGAKDRGTPAEAPEELAAAVDAGRRAIAEAVQSHGAAGALPAGVAASAGTSVTWDGDLLAAIEAEAERRRAISDAARGKAGETRATRTAIEDQIARHPAAAGGDLVAAAETELHSLDDQIAALELQLGDAAAHCQVDPETKSRCCRPAGGGNRAYGGPRYPGGPPRAP